MWSTFNKLMRCGHLPECHRRGTSPALAQVSFKLHRPGGTTAGTQQTQEDSLMRVNMRKGFTLIELLIVVVIIGILAAIAIPKFANTKEKAYLASMKSDLRNLATAEESFFADNQTYSTNQTAMNFS